MEASFRSLHDFGLFKFHFYSLVWGYYPTCITYSNPDVLDARSAAASGDYTVPKKRGYVYYLYNNIQMILRLHSYLSKIQIKYAN